ncbi:MAG: beta-propeller domain-containing protein [Actinomycetota bacterium]
MRKGLIIAICVLVAVSGGVAIARWQLHPASTHALPTATPTVSGTPTTVTATPTTPAKAAVALRSFDSCASILNYAKSAARSMVGPYGIQSYGGATRGDFAVAAPAAAQAEGASKAQQAAGTGDTSSSEFSQTNVQEEGVDEPDVVKTDGKRILAIAQGKLQYIDLTAGGSLAGSMDLPQGSHQLLLVGNRALVLTSKMTVYKGGPEPMPMSNAGGGVAASYYQHATLLSDIDVTNPKSMKTLATLDLDGNYVAARMVDGVVRVVLRSYEPNRIQFVYPESSDSEATKQAETRNREILQASTIDKWVPRYTFTDLRPITPMKREAPVCACAQIRRPAEFSGLGMISVFTVDLAKGLRPAEPVGIFADGDIVYASKQSLYVATNRWFDTRPLASGQSVPVPTSYTTKIHKFDIAGRGQAKYLASGEVHGFLLSQWALSEQAGYLRVASTDAPVWWNETQAAESFVTVLSQTGGALARVGQVGGLGKGERIYAVRFIGNLGYVVTFRQIDPLYVIDVSKPSAPRVLGELKILGYSAYLHPVGKGLLLGVGQDATEEGRQAGTQLSLFDVSDPINPKRVQQTKLGAGASQVEYEHKAFLYWPAKKLAVIPVQLWQSDPQTGMDKKGFNGAIGFNVGSLTGIRELGRIEHPTQQDPGGCAQATPANPDQPQPYCYQFSPPIERSLVVGDLLYTLSEYGLMASNIDTLSKTSWVAFPVSTSSPDGSVSSGSSGSGSSGSGTATSEPPAKG